MLSEKISSTRQAQSEALTLAEEILRNIELSEMPLTNIALKTSRLARLLNEFDVEMIMANEAGGYPITPTGIPSDSWRLCGLAGRHYEYKDSKTNEISIRAYTDSIGQMEEQVNAYQIGLTASRDPDIAISSSNPSQYVFAPLGNTMQRNGFIQQISTILARLASRRAFIHQFVSQTYYELKFSGIADDIFIRTSRRVDETIVLLIPDAVKRLTAAYENLRSDNPEDWSNAVHSCRRVLEDLADAVFPATETPRTKEINGKSQIINLGQSNYINRILAFVDDNSKSIRFNELIGSHIQYLADRLSSVYKAANKGTHDTITRQEEADRYVIYTYLLVGDILSLRGR